MKRIKLLGLSTCAVLFIAACGPTTENKTADTQETEKSIKAEKAKVEVAEENKVSKLYTVSGMVCEFGCAKFIEEEVAAYPGVVEFKVNYEGETAEIVYDKSQTDSEEIMEYVSGLNDGQYAMTEIDPSAVPTPKKTESVKDSAQHRGMDASAEMLPKMQDFRFSFPKIITYFMKRL